MTNAGRSKTDELTLSGELDAHSLRVSAHSSEPERREKARIHEPFATNAWGFDARGERFEMEANLENMSSKGAYLRLPRQMKLGDQLNLRIKFSNGVQTGATALVLGRVLRVKPGVDGLNGIALAIEQCEFV